MMRVILLAMAAMSMAGPAFAHAGHGAGFAAGLAHPFLGLDHLLAMLAVGALAAREARRWVLPLGFLAAMAAGIGLGQAGLGFAGQEFAILASVILLGLALVFPLALPGALAVAAVAGFGLCHGLAHGAEAGGSGVVLVGMLAGTAALQGLGLLAGMALRGMALRAGGAAVTAAGLGLLVQAVSAGF